MYYDRSVPKALLAMILPGGPLGWLVSWVDSEEGSVALADLQLRKNRSGACLQLYLGATSVLSIRLTQGRIRFVADKAYTRVAPSLFVTTHDRDALVDARIAISEYLAKVRGCIADRYLTAESQIHGGFMRRYGLKASPSDPCVVLDREVKIGSADTAERSLIRLQLDAGLPKKFSGNYVELDAIAVLSSGGIGLVEIKDQGDQNSLRVAAEQAAAHVLRFSMLDGRDAGWRRNLVQLAQQKVDAKLLPRMPELAAMAALVPIIAASDDRSDWADCWRTAIRLPLDHFGNALAGLQMWRLSRSGGIEEQVTP
jgi:hypothetical protein